jgi:hypothetical protein
MLSLALRNSMKRQDYASMGDLFLSDTKTKMIVKFLKHAKHFIDDNEERDIYEITFQRGKRKWSFNFGQSILKSKKPKEKPTSYDVLACLTKYEVGSFKDFCSEFGYDEGERKAHLIYKEALKEWENVQKIWTDEEIEMLREIN